MATIFNAKKVNTLGALENENNVDKNIYCRLKIMFFSSVKVIEINKSYRNYKNAIFCTMKKGR